MPPIKEKELDIATLVQDWNAASLAATAAPHEVKSHDIKVPSGGYTVLTTVARAVPLRLINCKFIGGSVIFQGCTGPGLMLNKCVFPETLEFHGCALDEVVLTNATRVTRELAIDGGRLGSLSLTIGCKLQSLHVRKSSAIGRLEMNDGDVLLPNGHGPNITVDASRIDELVLVDVRLHHHGAEGLAIQDRAAIGMLELKGVECRQVRLHDSTVESSVRIVGGSPGDIEVSGRCTLRNLALIDLNGGQASDDGPGVARAESSFKVEDSTITGNVTVDGCTLDRIDLLDSELFRMSCTGSTVKDMLLSGTRLTKELRLEGTAVKGHLSIIRSSEVQHLESKSITLPTAGSTGLERVGITGAAPLEARPFTCHDLSITDSRLVWIRIGKDAAIDRFTVTRSPLPSGTMTGRYSEIVFTDLASVQHTLALNDIRLDHFGVSKFFNLGDITFAGVRFNAKGGVTLDRSDMGRTNLIDMNLGNAVYFKYRDTTLSNVRFMNTAVPEKILAPLEEGGTLDDHTRYSQLQLAYSNLSEAFKRSEEFAKAREYHSKALDAHRRALRNDKHPSWRKRFNRFALRINGLSNGHGYDISRATLTLLVAPMICYFVFCLTQHIHPSLAPGSWDNFVTVATHYLEFAYIPLRPLESNSEVIDLLGGGQMAVGFAGRLVDILSRVISGYLIYQFVQAFRHFSRNA